MTDMYDNVPAVAAGAAPLAAGDAAPAPGPHINGVNGGHVDAPPEPGANGWRARAGREGARRVHELIREGRLYEQERGLKRGRQRLRQLIELGKLYEQEHGLRPALPRRSGRLSRAGRDEVMATLLHCLVRIAKPSFRAELMRLIERLPAGSDGAA